MRYEWEGLDVAPGRLVESHNRAERYILGYDPTIGHEVGNLTLCCLNDGRLAVKNVCREKMANYLNASRMRPIELRLDDVGPDSE